jgi:hypothetical protein
LGVAALPQPPKSQLIHAAIVPAQDLMRRNALSFIAVNGDRFRCIQPRIRTRDSWCSGRVACGGRPLALLLAATGTYTRPQSTIWQSAHGAAARGNCADLRHFRITLDTTRIMQSRAERRGIWNGLCDESRIDDLACMGIHRHLWWRVSAASRRCTTASGGPQGITSQCAHSETGP